MHIPDGFLDAPTALATGAVSVGVVAVAAKRAARDLGERTVPLLGVTAAFVFAAQMLNFPIAAGTSGHFLGAVFAVALLGPWAASLVMTVVVVIQALLMGDGGLTALGANVLQHGGRGRVSWAVVSSTCSSDSCPRLLPATSLALAIASWTSIVLGGRRGRLRTVALRHCSRRRRSPHDDGRAHGHRSGRSPHHGGGTGRRAGGPAGSGQELPGPPGLMGMPPLRARRPRSAHDEKASRWGRSQSPV